MDSSFEKGELSMVHLVYCDDKEKVLEKILDGCLIIEKIEDVVVGTSIPYNYDKSKFQVMLLWQFGTRFIKDGKECTLNVRDLCSQARKANIYC